LKRVYSSNYRCELNIFQLISLFFTEIFSYRKYIKSTILNDIKAKYKQDNLGLLWSIILPIVPMSLYILLATIKAFKESENIPHIFYIAVGMTVWLLISEFIVSTMKSIKKNKTILLKSNFPFSVIYISSIGELLLNTFVRIMVVGIIVIYFHIDLKLVNIILGLLFLMPVLLFAFSVGIILSIFDIYIPDTKRLVDMFLRYGLFLSSVIFPFPKDGVLGELNQFNIFNTFIEGVRNILYFGSLESYSNYVICSGITFVLFLIALFLSLKLEFKVRGNL